jgi:hypothetical protein
MNDLGLSSTDVVTALVHRGTQAAKAGLQFQINGRLHEGFILEAAHKKKPMRLAVGEPGCRSSVWRIWAHHNASDVYISTPRTAAFHKISLHESGDWRYQLIGRVEEVTDIPSVGWTIFEEELEGRVLGSWERPQSTINGWIDAMRIVVPTSEVVTHPRTYGEPGEVSRTRWIKPPPAGFAADIRFFIVQPGKGPFGLNDALVQKGGFIFCGGMALPSGESLVVISSSFPVGADLHEQLQETKAKGLAAEDFDNSYEHAPRILVPEVEPNYATFWDLSGH